MIDWELVTRCGLDWWDWLTTTFGPNKGIDVITPSQNA